MQLDIGSCKSVFDPSTQEWSFDVNDVRLSLPKIYEETTALKHATLSTPNEELFMPLCIGSYKLVFGLSTQEWSFDMNDFRLSLPKTCDETIAFKMGIPSLKLANFLTHSNNKVTYTQNLGLYDFETRFSDSKLGDHDIEFDAFEASLQGSFLEEKFEKYTPLSWPSILNSCKEIALERISHGQRTIPKLKNFIYELESAKSELELIVKLIYQGNENHLAFNLTLQDLSPIAQLKVYLSKELIPFFASSPSTQGELLGLDSYDGTWELKKDSVHYNGSPIPDSAFPEWESIPILTEAICIDLLGIPKEEYHKYIK